MNPQFHNLYRSAILMLSICTLQPIANFAVVNLINDDLVLGRLLIYWGILFFSSFTLVRVLYWLAKPHVQILELTWVAGVIVLLLFNEYLFRVDIEQYVSAIGWPHKTVYLIELVAISIAGLIVYSLSRQPVFRYASLMFVSVITIWDVAQATNLIHQLHSHVNAASKLQKIEITPSPRNIFHPNVYYILPDTHIGEEIFNEIHIDPIIFDGLRERGFRVVDGAHSNATVTTYSMAHLFNMELILDGINRINFALTRSWIHRLDETPVMKEFRRRGYQYIHVYDGYDGPDCPLFTDICIRNQGVLHQQEFKFLNRTPLFRIWSGLNVQIHKSAEPVNLLTRPNRMEISEIVRRLPNPEEGPYFLFSHLSLPHPPYRFDADCSYTALPYGDIAYKAQLQCAGRQLLFLMDTIRERDPHAIIVLQSDTGIIFESITDQETLLGWPLSGYPYRFSILSAFHGPASCLDYLIDELSPVNTFRWVFSCLDDQQPVFLEDRGWATRYLADVPDGTIVEWSFDDNRPVDLKP